MDTTTTLIIDVLVDPSLTSPYSWRCPESVLYFIAEPFSIGRWNIDSRNFPSSTVSQQCYFYKHSIDRVSTIEA